LAVDTLRSDGTVWAWGTNFYGALGNGTTIPYDWVPAPVLGITGATAIASGSERALALGSLGLMAWGDDHWGQLGLGRMLQHNEPNQVPSFTLW